MSPASPNEVRPITLDVFQRMFALPSRRRAKNLMRRMRHIEERREIYTTHEWLAAWLATRALPGMDRPAVLHYNPLEDAVLQRAVALISSMAARGELTVGPALQRRLA